MTLWIKGDVQALLRAELGLLSCDNVTHKLGFIHCVYKGVTVTGYTFHLKFEILSFKVISVIQCSISR